VISFITSNKRSLLFQSGVEYIFRRLWCIAQPLFYGIMGAQINVSSISVKLLGKYTFIITKKREGLPSIPLMFHNFQWLKNNIRVLILYMVTVILMS